MSLRRARTVVVSGVFAVVAMASPRAHADPTPAPVAPSRPGSSPVVARARLEVEREVTYDSSYVGLSYPNGDPAPDRGVCTDVVVRSLRTIGVDLQQKIHEDILAHPTAYPTVAKADRNIDHRRATPMLVYLGAHATSLTRTFERPADWQPGDIVIWSFGKGRADHVGIVSDRQGPRGLPLILHNIGPKPSEADVIDAWTVLGHFRVAAAPVTPPTKTAPPRP